MPVTFPTRPRGEGKPGTPDRAVGCRCGTQQILDEHGDGCGRCGHYTPQTIERTWRKRAEVIALGASRRRDRLLRRVTP